MLDLFRYVEWHAPKVPAERDDVIALKGDSDLRARLRDARGAGNAAQEMRRLASAFIASPQYAMRSQALTHKDGLERVLAFAREATARQLPGLASELAAMLDVTALSTLTGTPTFAADKRNLGDSLIAAKILGETCKQDFPALMDLARAMALIERMAAADPLVATRTEVDRILAAAVSIPNALLLSDRAPPAQASPPAPPMPTEMLRQLSERKSSLQKAVTFLGTLNADDFTPAPARSGEGDRQAGRSSSGTVGQSDRRAFGTLLTRFLRGPGSVSQSITRVDHVVLSEAARGRLPAEATSVLADLHVEVEKTPVTTMIDKLQVNLASVEQQLWHLTPFQAAPLYQLGQYFFVLSSQAPPLGASTPFPSPAPSIKIHPVGYGDLQVVKQQIVRYEAGEVSYVENVLKGEEYQRSVERRELQEETVVSERERIKEEERDLQATDRFELRTESENTAKNSVTTTAGNTVTTQYGALVESRGSMFARDVVNRTVDKLTERVREQRTVRMQRELIDKTAHAFSNSQGTGHVSGVYQWIDKIYEAQVYNCGKRLLYEAIIPEPAAFLIEMRKKVERPDMDLRRPPEPTFGPWDLGAWNYAYYAKAYDVVGVVEPPPAEYVRVQWATREARDSESTLYVKDSIPITPGYKALRIVYYWVWAQTWPTAEYHITIGGNKIMAYVKGVFDGNPDWSLTEDTLSLPVSIAGFDTSRLNLVFSVLCQRLPEHHERWQLRTYEALMKGYKRQKDEYEERLANMQALARAQMLMGGSDYQNRQFEQVELKKAFLTVLTNQHFEAFDSVRSVPPLLYPETDVSAAVQQAGFVSFFERAFEWQNMLYYFYPYFWGRKAEWDERVLIQDTDPQFEAFLKAGAVRVVVPVRPGFEGAIAHYAETGQVWLGEDQPDMYSDLFVSIMQEIKDRDRAPGDETPVGEPWEVRLPTTLVKLRTDDTLPEWEKSAEGKWQPKS